MSKPKLLERCPNPDCGNVEEFTPKNVRFLYDTQFQMGTSSAQSTPREKISTWECNACHCLIEVHEKL